MVRVLFQLIPTPGGKPHKPCTRQVSILSMIWKKKDLYNMLKCFDSLPSPVFCLLVCLLVCLSVCLFCPHYFELHVLVVTWPPPVSHTFLLAGPTVPCITAGMQCLHMTSSIAPIVHVVVNCPHCQTLWPIPWLNGLIPRCSGLNPRLANISMYCILDCIWIYWTSAINLRAI